MKQSKSLLAIVVGSVVAWWAVSASRPCPAAEEAWRFLEGLRQRGYYELAVEYLEKMRESPLCPDDLKEVIDYETGATLVTASRLPGSPRERQLGEARGCFQKFLKDHPEHPLAATANTQLGIVLIEQGKIQVDLASRPSKSEEEKKQLTAEARALYQQAQEVFVAAEKHVYERAKVLEREAKTDPKMKAERDQGRRDLLQARLYLAAVEYEIGHTYEPDSQQYKEHLTSAAEKYNELYEKYGQFTAGQYARMQEGRAYKDLGEADKAIEIFKETLALEGGDETSQMLKNQSLAMLLETYLLPKVNKYEEAAAEAKKWQDGARAAEESTAEGLKIHFLGGKAALALAQQLKDDDSRRRQNLQAARQHLEVVSRSPGQFQAEARSLLLQKPLGGKTDVDQEPAEFDDATSQGDIGWGKMVLAYGSLQQAATTDEQQKATARMNEARDEAIRSYRIALGLGTDDIPELNRIRSRLAYLYFLSDDFYRAAVMGEFVARRYPESPGARQAAEIAVKAYRALYAQAAEPEEERAFETGRMRSMAQYIITRWPDEPVAGEAQLMLFDTAIDNRDLDQAQQYLTEIAPDSPARAQAELRMGQALWLSYVQESNKPEAERPPQATLDGLVKRAQKTLEEGISRMRKSAEQGGRIDYTLVYSVLSLAQIYINAGQSEEAVEWLDDPKIGPVTLVAADHPVTDRGSFRVETYKAALRAYVGAQQLDKAQKAMDALEKLVTAGGDAAAAKKLTDIYIVLGRELQQTLKRLRQENKQKEAEEVVQGFEVFLNQISERGETFSSLNWVAETFYNLGASLDSNGDEPPQQAQDYYQSAAATYVKILKAIKADKNFAPAGGETNTLVRLAACLRALDKHEDAMKCLTAVLKSHERRVDVQIEAAQTYQDWGRMKGEAKKYLLAIAGDKVDGRLLIWGWGGIARRVAPFPQYESVFHEARYNLALCRRDFALTQKGAQRAKTLEMAEREILAVHQLYPKMGGQEWKAKYNALLMTVQKGLGKRPTGLPD